MKTEEYIHSALNGGTTLSAELKCSAFYTHLIICTQSHVHEDTYLHIKLYVSSFVFAKWLLYFFTYNSFLFFVVW